MSSKSKRIADKAETLQIRVPRDEKRGAELIAKLEKIAEKNGLSLNAAANLAMAAGLGMVEVKLREIHEPSEQAA